VYLESEDPQPHCRRTLESSFSPENVRRFEVPPQGEKKIARERQTDREKERERERGIAREGEREGEREKEILLYQHDDDAALPHGG
jgi:hypothetical protein